MDVIGLFPLPIVLLPTEHVPLHIFEPRYRELIAECLDEEREFGLVLATDDGLEEVGTRAHVAEVTRRFEDGRLDVVVEGGERFRLLEVLSERSFATGTVEPFRDAAEATPPEAESVTTALELFDRIVALADVDVRRPDPDDPLLSFALAGTFELAVPLKQRLLRARSEADRLAVVVEILTRAADAADRREAIVERAQGNGHVRFSES